MGNPGGYRMTGTSWQDLRIAEGKGVRCGRSLGDNNEGLVNPPGVPNVDLLAFYVSRMYSEFEAAYPPNPDARAQFIRVTPDGLEPAREMLPG